MENYRKLSADEIKALSQQGCSAESWKEIMVHDSFDASLIHNCRFMGKVLLGRNVRIRNIGAYIANCRIDDDAYIENTAQIECRGACRFGGGVRVKTVNEGGGREVMLFSGLSSQIAYVLAMYRHRPETIGRIESMIGSQLCRQESDMCIIGCGTRITNSGILRNVTVGAHAVVEGADILENGTVESSAVSSAKIGAGVKMYDFIMADSSSVTNGAVIKSCFIGQGVKISALSAVDTLFFANSHFENGETCSVFAGPYSVSHHKSSLLIAGMFSFFNAGSATNMSNHLFKTGPVHQGIYRRGCKFASGAYVMEPADIGAFSVILGHHKSHPDTKDFPFSYLIDDNGTTLLLPAHNLTTYGTVRDMAKWPLRDNRKGTKEDIVNYTEANPFVCEHIVNGERLLTELSASQPGAERYTFRRMSIKSSMLRRGIDLYNCAKYKYLAEMLSAEPHSDTTEGVGHWIDAGGEFMPASVMERLLEDIDNGSLATVEQIKTRFHEADEAYADYARNWALDTVAGMLGHTPSQADIAEILAKGSECSARLTKTAERDKQSDYDDKSRIGYGVDSVEAQVTDGDFAEVRRGQGK